MVRPINEFMPNTIDPMNPVKPTRHDEALTCGAKVKRWCKKYLFEGQHLDDELADKMANLPANPTIGELLLIKHRKFVAMLIPFGLIWLVWWSAAIRHNFFQYYADYWHMPVTMVLGSFVGGMTSEGSGAVAFPVMTLALHIAPEIARDFSLMIQSIGMTSALVCVLFMKVKFEHRAVAIGALGAVPGFIIGVHYIDPMFTGPQKKMLFVSIWTAFAFALGILNAQKKRSTFAEIPEFCVWKAFVLLVTGVIGGVFDAFAGSGIDICIFSIVTLLFRVTEKTATPTTVVLKGIIAVFGFYYRAVMMGDIDATAWRYFQTSVPVSAAAGPIGSFVGSHLHRQLIAGFVYVLELIALVGFLFTRPAWTLIVFGGVIILGGFVFFSIVSKLGAVLMENIERRHAKDCVINGNI
ncbi:unnamed protein product [Caenorhabditis bovis]|uniref:Membrane transporter protein n=1 Tax=Caenorhabditis bovis TaxID=2654633 RepID=A0A8S1EMV6_9PELO|nr:unnamed protein product [Caenorhabditis bovis]